MPDASRREFLRFGLSAFGSLSLPALFQSARRRGGQSGRADGGHHRLAARRRQPPGHLRPQARRPGRLPRPVRAARRRGRPGCASPNCCRGTRRSPTGSPSCGRWPTPAAGTRPARSSCSPATPTRRTSSQPVLPRLHERRPPPALRPAPRRCPTTSASTRSSATTTSPSPARRTSGEAYEPFAVTGDPNAPTFRVPNVGLAEPGERERLAARAKLHRHPRRPPPRPRPLRRRARHGPFQEQAINLLTSPEAARAFDLNRESPKVRDRYGRNAWGQQLLMARRLVEAGVEIVTTDARPARCAAGCRTGTTTPSTTTSSTR